MLEFLKKKTSPSPTVMEYVVLVCFVAVVVFGLFFAVTQFLGTRAPGSAHMGTAAQKTAVPAPVAPTAAQYEAAARGVMAPFLEQAQKMTKADFGTDTTAMQQLVVMTQQRLLGLRVPKEYLQTHLALVLLLDQWKRALAGSVADQKTVLQKTADAVAADPWLSAPTPSSAP